MRNCLDILQLTLFQSFQKLRNAKIIKGGSKEDIAIPLVDPANEQGRIVADNICGDKKSMREILEFLQ